MLKPISDSNDITDTDVSSNSNNNTAAGGGQLLIQCGGHRNLESKPIMRSIYIYIYI